MLIKTEDLAPKTIINFYVPSPMIANGSSLLFFKNEKIENDFVLQILSIEGVKRCLIVENLLSVQYSDIAEKEDIKALVLAEIDDYVNEGTSLSGVDDKTDLLVKCGAVADALIRPTLNRDKGDIALLSLQNGVLEVQFTGHCAGCPYAQNTLQNVIVRTFRRCVQQIENVKLKE
ncbi:MAG: NifU family protein [Alphaproteobacteria bacterium]|nr:NifU family protein [Alphaproteobacteria bacterium]